MKGFAKFAGGVAFLLCLIAIWATHPKGAQADGTIYKYRTYELAFTSSKTYSNPFDPQIVDFKATFTGPGNQQLTVIGFWDGGSTWKVRFNPPSAGNWSYVTANSDVSDTGLNNRTGSFSVAEAIGPNPLYLHGGMLKVSNDKRSLTYQDGTPFFYLADTWWGAPSWSLPIDRPANSKIPSTIPHPFEYAIDKRVSQDYTVIQVHGSESMTANDPLNNLGYIFTQLDNTTGDIQYWQEMDKYYQIATEKGIVLNVGVSNFQFFDGRSLDELKCLYRYMLARFGSYSMMFLMTQEYNGPLMAGESTTDRTSRIDNLLAVADYLKDMDPFKRLITFHMYPLPKNMEWTSKAFTMVADDGGYTEYTIDMSDIPNWTGTLKQLRIDPGDARNDGETNGKSFSLDYVSIGEDQQTPVQVWNFDSDTEGWQAAHQISGFGPEPGGYVGGAITGEDPYIVSAEHLGIDITTNKIVKIRMKNGTTSITGKVYFTTETPPPDPSDPSWDEDWNDYIMYQDGHFHTPSASDYTFLYNRDKVQPILEAELNYENFKRTGISFAVDGISTDTVSDWVIRSSAYTAIQSGSFGFGYGALGSYNGNDDVNKPIAWAPQNDTWWNALDAPGAAQLQWLRKAYELTEWWKLVPHPDAVAAFPTVLVKSDEDVTHLLRYPKSLNVPAGTILSGVRDGGTYSATWINPRDGQLTEDDDITAIGEELPLPAKPDSEDWLLLLKLQTTDIQTWGFDSDAEGWTAAHQISGFGPQTGGYVGGTITGEDPYIMSASNLGIDITDNPIVKVRLKNDTTSRDGRIYFTTAANSNWQHKGFTMVKNDSGYTEYMIDMSDVTGWTGTLKQLRLDPGDARLSGETNGGSFSLDAISIGHYLTAEDMLAEPETDLASMEQLVDDYIASGNIVPAFAADLSYRLDIIGILLEQGNKAQAANYMADFRAHILDESVLQQQLISEAAAEALDQDAGALISIWSE